jgi:hypothetical protein
MANTPEDAIGAVLRPGERSLWAGRPLLGIRLRAVDAVLAPLSVLGIGAAGYFVYYGVAQGAPSCFMLFGAVFLFALLSGQLDRYLGDAWRRRRTFYGVTTERVIVLSGGDVTSLPWSMLPEVSLFEGEGGAGVIAFGPCSRLLGWSLRTGFPLGGKGLRPVTLFDLATDASRVYAVIQLAHQSEVSSAGAIRVSGTVPAGKRS